MNVGRTSFKALLAVLACAATLGYAAEPVPGGTLRIGQPGDIQGFDPAIIPTENYIYLYQVYSTLTLYDDDFNVTPQLATSWERAEDGRSLVLHLRQDVRFHDGRPFVAEDVRYSLERIQDPALGANLLGLSDLVADVEVLDDHTVRLAFDDPAPAIFDLLDAMFIVDEATIEDPDATPNGTGPFRFESWQPGTSLRLVRNDDYWKEGLPYLDEIVVRPFSDNASLVANLRAGALDLVKQPSMQDFARLDGTAGFVGVRGTQGSYVNDLILNVTRPPLDDKRVRQAINFAVNREQFVNTYLNGIGEAWYQPLPSHSIGYDPSIGEPYAYDLDAARRLLAEAGYADGFDITIISSGSWLPGSTATAQILQNSLREIGINATVRELERAAARPLFIAGDFDIFAHGYGRATKDPAFLYGAALAWVPGGAHQYDAPEYADLVAQGSSTTDPAARKDIYQQIARLVVDESFVIPIASNPKIWLLDEAVEGFASNLESQELLEATWLDR